MAETLTRDMANMLTLVERLEDYADDMDHTERPALGEYDVTADIRMACSLARAHIEAREGVGRESRWRVEYLDHRFGWCLNRKDGGEWSNWLSFGQGGVAEKKARCFLKVAHQSEKDAADALTALQAGLAAARAPWQPVEDDPKHIAFRKAAMARAMEVDVSEFAGDLDPGDENTVEGLARTIAIVLSAYDWAIDDQGRLFGLVAGDHGYAATTITVEDADALADKEAELTALKADNERLRRASG